jgi:hypothetical protein
MPVGGRLNHQGGMPSGLIPVWRQKGRLAANSEADLWAGLPSLGDSGVGDHVGVRAEWRDQRLAPRSTEGLTTSYRTG